MTKGDTFIPTVYANVTIVVLTVLGWLEAFLIVAILGLIFQKWRQENSAEVLECFFSHNPTYLFDK